MARIAKDYGYTLAELRRLYDDDHMSTTLRAEFFYDDEVNNWHYRVPALHINGGGAATREDAERQCLEAISFALEGDPSEYDRDTQAIALRCLSLLPPEPCTDGDRAGGTKFPAPRGSRPVRGRWSIK